ncbi:thiamine ABC transporter substrate binding subunit [Hahella ganghwensis]|uniref:thiamine ABC transporter substrate binding subunit n=1 Tax=Hahella ganghwensis TaxID=286420 RepID=UPI000363EA15|nr:thiamine ABC transporter substrate binding subunit [Hahella ganghwensis]
MMSMLTKHWLSPICLAAAISLSSQPLLAADSDNAEKSTTLTIYTYDSFVSEWGPGPQLEKLFEEQCHCDLKFVGAEDGVSVLNRLRLEGDNTKADVILGIDNGLIEEARDTNLLQTHSVDTSVVKDSLNWADKTFIPFDYGYFAFIYNAEKIKKPAESMQALLDSEASIIYQDPRTSTPGQGLMMWMNSVYGDNVDQAWKQLAQQTVTVTKGWWEAYSMFLEGGSDYVLSYSTSPAYHMVAEGNTQYKAALFSEGHIAQIEVAAITRNTENRELANQFLNFLVSKEAQQIIPITNWMLPVIDGVELPEAFDQLIQPRDIGFSSDHIANNRKSWIREWRSVVTQ